MSKKFNKNLALIALVSTIALGGSASLADAASNHPAKFASSFGWKLPTGAKMFTGVVSLINGTHLTISHPNATSTGSGQATNTPNVLVNTNASTTYLGGSFASIAVGTRLSGIGLKQADGSFNAQTIRLNPAKKAPVMKRQQNAGLRPFFGTITGLSGSSITISQGRGKSNGKANSAPITINITASTTFAIGTLANLTVGTKVSGLGTKNADKSITALKINPGTDRINLLTRGHGKKEKDN